MRLSVKNRPLKISHSYEYTFSNSIIKISLSKQSLLFPVFDERQNRQVGFLLDGPIEVIADLITHSDKGATGELIDETFSTVIFFPVDLPFLSLDHVKENAPVDEFYRYQDMIDSYNKLYRLSRLEMDNYNKHVLLITEKPRTFWLISPNSTFLIRKKEIIGRKGQNKLFWISDKGLVSVSKDGKYRSLSDILDFSRAKNSFQNIFGKPLSILFMNLQDAFSKMYE